MTSRRTRVAVLFGGRSTEHSISCVSAASVLRALDRDQYDVVAVGIAPDGRWVLGPDDPKALEPAGRELPSVDEDSVPVALPGDPSIGGIVVLSPTAGSRSLENVDVVFPVLHGPYGEDGTVQGLLELAGIPYVGSGVFACAAAMDKAHMKLLLRAHGLEVGEYEVVRAGTDARLLRDRCEHLGLPVFVKPARGGSSLGITRVTDWDDLCDAVENACELGGDPKVLVEAAIVGREIECGVLGGLHCAPPEASVPAEIRVRGGHEFYDFEAKYLDGTAEFDVPAKVDDDTFGRLRQLAVRAFEALDCEGLARVDFFLRADGSILVNEVNTMPGFTPQSLFPRMWAATGVEYPALVDRLLLLALERGTGLR